MDNALFYQKFGVPQAALSLVDGVPVIDRMVSPLEQRVIVALEKDVFTCGDIAGALKSLGETVDVQSWTEHAYRRGVISVETPGYFRVASFYERLDIFAISENPVYRSFPKETQKALDAWYFDAYYRRLTQPNQTDSTQLSSDSIVPLAQALERIDTDARQLYLAPCDCRSLSGDCGKPVMTCLSWRSGANTFAGRGHSKPVSKETAKQIVVDAEKAGLMHTANANTICNCCDDCCYLFRARKRLTEEKRVDRSEQSKNWPASDWIISYKNENCIGCGICSKRCHFGVLGNGHKKPLAVRTENCVGCGICVSTCPAGALKLQGRQKLI
jgi:NAD-dependent dihydropyrimidine dehydrogenase PreA subunit